jgi:hypothetical protein
MVSLKLGLHKLHLSSNNFIKNLKYYFCKLYVNSSSEVVINISLYLFHFAVRYHKAYLEQYKQAGIRKKIRMYIMTYLLKAGVLCWAIAQQTSLRGNSDVT